MGYKNEIISYYDSSQWQYRLFIYNTNTLGMHFGFYEKNTKSIHEAIINVNKSLIDVGKIKKGDIVLDAGCGVGGTAIYIAKTVKAKVFGTSLSKKQVKLAKKYSEKHKVSQLTKFTNQDYEHTNFPDNFFDVVYGIESVCYSYPKEKFLKEAMRILKPKGRLIIIDGYLSRSLKNRKEREIVKNFKKGFALREFMNYKKMTRKINTAGFKQTKTYVKTKEVMPSVEFFHNMIQKKIWLMKILTLIPHPYFQSTKMNELAIRSAHEGVEQKFASYYIHYAEKPNG